MDASAPPWAMDCARAWRPRSSASAAGSSSWPSSWLATEAAGTVSRNVQTVATGAHQMGTSIREIEVNTRGASGVTNQAMQAMEEAFKASMPNEMGFSYMGMSYQEKRAQEGVSPAAVFAMSLLFVFLILAAQYESWSLPFSVLLSVPIAVFGAFAGILVGKYELNVYAQIGLVMLIGLAAKNAILIVEFAKMKHEQGLGLAEAALEAAKLRLRPILMTSFAFILGCVPLATAKGAGALSRQVMGYVVIGGMLTASFIAIFLIPALYYMVGKLTGADKKVPTPPVTPAPVVPTPVPAIVH
jgi:HAE1 family hydrophobic/amphiphilic exporter-1